VHQRSAGKDALTILKEKRRRKKLKALIMVLLHDYRHRFLSSRVRLAGMLAAAYLHKMLKDVRRPMLVEPVPIPHRRLTYDSFDPLDYDRVFGFSKPDVLRLHAAFAIPDHFVLNEGRHAHRVSGQHSFLYLLYHFRTPAQRMSGDSNLFGYDYSVLSKMFSACLAWVDAVRGNLVHNLAVAADKFAIFNSKIVDKVRSSLQADAGLPPHAVDCVLFVDAMRLRVARPSGAYWRQRSVYSGHKKYHNLACQAVTGPDGIIYDWYTDAPGRHSDQYVMGQSGANDQLRELQLGHARQRHMYADKGYTELSHLRACARTLPGAAPQPAQASAMAIVRVPAEWVFEKVYERCPLLRHREKMKLQGCDVEQLTRVAVLLTNAHTCLHGSNTSSYFNCVPPTLEQYML
jgi:hypothetical protein